MKANELMVGDWVRHINGTPYQVTCIKDGHFACSIPHLWEYNNKFEPIPLTAEILEKNGWKYSDLPFVQGWEQFGLLLYAGGEGYRISCGNNVAMRIDSVHELQHALRLCGITHEIVL